MELDVKEIGRKVREAREGRRLSYRQLGERASVSHGYIQYLEQGARQKIDFTKLGRVAAAMGLPLSHFVGIEAYEDEHGLGELDELVDMVAGLSREDRDLVMMVVRRIHLLQELQNRGVMPAVAGVGGVVPLRESEQERATG